MKEMMIKLPTIKMAAGDDIWLAKHYPKSGRYIILRDNGDVEIADIRKILPKDGEPCVDTERVTDMYSIYLGTLELIDPDQWETDIRSAAEAEVENIRCKMEELRSSHECDMAEKERDYKAMIDAAREDAVAARDDLAAQRTILKEKMDQQLAMRRIELDHEYERKVAQLELDIPKRFGQGEWISGKTLTEIIRSIVGSKE